MQLNNDNDFNINDVMTTSTLIYIDDTYRYDDR